jgi:L-cysteate sulfo-lyase
MRIESRARFPPAQLPTPIEGLKSLSRELDGPALLIKRDDQTGLALGGNKSASSSFW